MNHNVFSPSRVKEYSESIRQELISLKQDGCAVSLKGGTEAEDMDSHEIFFFQMISGDIVPMTIKIGGAEARQDIRTMVQLKVDCILAPMIESAYALTKFVEAVVSIGEEYGHIPKLAFNLETISAIQNLDSILESDAFVKIDRVTIGRDDLSQSMHLDIENDEVNNVSREAIKKIKNSRKQTSLGGSLSLSNIGNLVNKIPSDFFNTRHILFANSNVFKKDPNKILFKILDWEKKLCNLLCMISPKKEKYYRERVLLLSKRLNQISLVK